PGVAIFGISVAAVAFAGWELLPMAGPILARYPGLINFLNGLGQAPGTPAAFGAGSLGAAEVRILQTGGNTIRQATANALNDLADANLSAREWGRAVEALKDYYGLPNNFHGSISSTGDYLDQAHNV